MNRILERFGDWLAARGALYEIITRADPVTQSLYLRRYYLLKVGRFTVLLHQFFRSDPDGVHDHPWNNASIVLTGGYFERHHDGTCTWRAPGSVTIRTARELHRIELAPNTEGAVWTLFITGRRRRVWGFYKQPGVDWEAKYRVPAHDLRGHLFPRVVPRAPVAPVGDPS